MSRFLAELASVPAGGVSPLCRYIVLNGYAYMGLGLLLLLLPTPILELAAFATFDGYEPGLVRVSGMSLAVIGWFYVMGGRTGATSFALATVVDRLLVPFVLLPLAATGAAPPALVLPIAIGDPLLAIVALVIWRRS